MEIRRINDKETELKISNSKNKFLIEQLKFIGANPHKESRIFTYFRFKGSFNDVRKYLGLGI
ncbi:hypothetical protein C0L75_03310 [Clostridium perfringens]